MSARAVLLRWLVRATVLFFWALVLWGALLVLVTLADAFAVGPGPALAKLLPVRGASAWAWLNALSAALAVAVGVVAGGLLAWGTRARGPRW